MTRRSFASQRGGPFRRSRFAVPVTAPVLAAVAAFGLSGCASISEKFAATASQMPGIGLPAGAPERPATPVAYPSVHDIPPPRNSVTLTSPEQQQLEDDLVAARDRQQTSAGVALQAKKKKDQPAPGKVVPASSRASIY
jgi:hypothetical protein